MQMEKSIDSLGENSLSQHQDDPGPKFNQGVMRWVGLLATHTRMQGVAGRLTSRQLWVGLKPIRERLRAV
eukprot:1029856-Pyramimonas_sp.AAC.1